MILLQIFGIFTNIWAVHVGSHGGENLTFNASKHHGSHLEDVGSSKCSMCRNIIFCCRHSSGAVCNKSLTGMRCSTAPRPREDPSGYRCFMLFLYTVRGPSKDVDRIQKNQQVMPLILYIEVNGHLLKIIYLEKDAKRCKKSINETSYWMLLEPLDQLS